MEKLVLQDIYVNHPSTDDADNVVSHAHRTFRFNQ